jgi:hypothetical protein
MATHRVLEFTIIGLCYRCTQPVGYYEGRLTDTSWDEEICWPHDDWNKTHLVRDDIIAIAEVNYMAARPTAVWNALAALVRAERVPVGLRGSHVTSAAKALAAGRADA